MYYPNYNNYYKLKKKKSPEFLNRLVNNLAIVLIIFIVFVGLKFVRTETADKINSFLRGNIERDYTAQIKMYALDKLNKINLKSLNVFNVNEFKIKYLPVEGKIIVNFGDKINVSKDTSETSKGIIIQTNKVSDVKAVFDGVVEKIENNDKQGLILTIDHQNGYKSIYGYLNEIRFTEGERVKMGEVIGINSTEPSTKKYIVYFEMMQSNASVDPQKFIEKQ